jgi:hypothetical protein
MPTATRIASEYPHLTEKIEAMIQPIRFKIFGTE